MADLFAGEVDVRLARLLRPAGRGHAELVSGTVDVRLAGARARGAPATLAGLAAQAVRVRRALRFPTGTGVADPRRLAVGVVLAIGAGDRGAAEANGARRGEQQEPIENMGHGIRDREPEQHRARPARASIRGNRR